MSEPAGIEKPEPPLPAAGASRDEVRAWLVHQQAHDVKEILDKLRGLLKETQAIIGPLSDEQLSEYAIDVVHDAMAIDQAGCPAGTAPGAAPTVAPGVASAVARQDIAAVFGRFAAPEASLPARRRLAGRGLFARRAKGGR